MDSTEKLLKTVINSQYFAVLNSMGEGLPYSNLISFAVTGDLKTMVFVTDRNTRKYRNMQENSNISLLIDNRTNRPEDVNKAVAITVTGTVQEETDKKGRLRFVFLNRHPHLEQFLDNPGNALICVTVREYIIAGFDKTRHVVIS